VDVEADVSSVKDFIGETNSVVLLGHGVTTLGRNVSEAYHRLNSLTAEVRRNIAAELLAERAGSRPQYRTEKEIQAMYRFAEAIIYPKRAERVMHEE
jgi:ribulose-5-phosphate 4-epimerase/fuculose-1-phosphate aldolase